MKYIKLYENRSIKSENNKIIKSLIDRIKEIYEYNGITNIKLTKEKASINGKIINEFTLLVNDPNINKVNYGFSPGQGIIPNPYPFTNLLFDDEKLDIQFYHGGLSHHFNPTYWVNDKNREFYSIDLYKNRVLVEPSINNFIESVLEIQNIKIDSNNPMPQMINIQDIKDKLDKINIENYEFFTSHNKYNL